MGAVEYLICTLVTKATDGQQASEAKIDARLPGRCQLRSAHGEFFSKSYSITSKSDCIYHFPIDFEPRDFRLVPNQSENDKYNLISGSFNNIQGFFFCVWAVSNFYNNQACTIREAGDSRHHGASIVGPLKPSTSGQ